MSAPDIERIDTIPERPVHWTWLHGSAARPDPCPAECEIDRLAVHIGHRIASGLPVPPDAVRDPVKYARRVVLHLLEHW